MALGENVGENVGENTSDSGNALFLTPPINVYTADTTETTIVVSWTQSPQGAATGYRIYNNATGLVVATSVWGVDSVTVTSLNPGTTYVFYVVTTDGVSESAASNSAQGRTVSATLDAPVIVSVVPLDGAASVTFTHSDLWTTPDYYEFYVDNVPGGWISTVEGTRLISPLTNGVQVNITCKAFLNSGQTSIISNSYSVTPTSSSTTVIFTDDFESGDFNGGYNGFSWRIPTRVTVTNTFSRTGTHCARFEYNQSTSACTDSLAELPFYLGDQYEEVYLHFYIYYPDGTEGLGPKVMQRCVTAPCSDTTVNDKFYRLYGRVTPTSEAATAMGASTYPVSCEGRDLSTEWNYKDEGVVVRSFDRNLPFTNYWGLTDTLRLLDPSNPSDWGRWIEIKIRTKVASFTNWTITSGPDWVQNYGDGVIQIWKDGVLGPNLTNLPTFAGTNPDWPNAYTEGYILGASNSGYDQETFVYVDNFTFSNIDPAPY